MRCRGGAREMVLDMVFRFCCRNGGGRIYKIIGFAFDNLARKRAIQSWRFPSDLFSFLSPNRFYIFSLKAHVIFLTPASNSRKKALRSKRRISPYIVQVVASLATKACYYWHYLHWHRQFKIKSCNRCFDTTEATCRECLH
jgi:hypothetical protein